MIMTVKMHPPSFRTLFLYGMLLRLGASTVVIPNAIQQLPGTGAQCRQIDLDAAYRIEHGAIWLRRCHTCACMDGETVCWGPQCRLEYDLSFEYTCTQWSENGCCCEHVGCLIDGVQIDLDAWYPSPDYPCVSCQCSLGSRLCTFSEDCHADDVSLDEKSIR